MEKHFGCTFCQVISNVSEVMNILLQFMVLCFIYLFICVLGMTLKGIRWQGLSQGWLGLWRIECGVAITPRPTLAWSGSTSQSASYGSSRAFGWMELISLGKQSLILNLRCLAAICCYGKGFRSKPQENPELEPLRQSVVALSLALAAPATVLVPNHNDLEVPLETTGDMEGGNKLHRQQSVLRITLPRLVSKHLKSGEDTPASPQA